MKTQTIGTLFIVSAPSGAGKSSLINAYLTKAELKKACVSISHTTRAPRVGEADGVHYHFVTHDEFESLIKQDAFIEYAHVFDNYYGTSKANIEKLLQQGIHVFLDIDWQGARLVREAMPDAKSIFILPPSLKELESRLIKRSQDSLDVIEKRMQKAKSEMSHYDEYDYLIINDDFETSLGQLASIINSESLITAKQKLAHQPLIDELLD